MLLNYYFEIWELPARPWQGMCPWCSLQSPCPGLLGKVFAMYSGHLVLETGAGSMLSLPKSGCRARQTRIIDHGSTHFCCTSTLVKWWASSSLFLWMLPPTMLYGALMWCNLMWDDVTRCTVWEKPTWPLLASTTCWWFPLWRHGSAFGWRAAAQVFGRTRKCSLSKSKSH